MSLKKGRITIVDKDYIESEFGLECLNELIEEFSANNFRAEILRRDFKVPVIIKEVMISEDMKYIIDNKKPMLASNITKITMQII